MSGDTTGGRRPAWALVARREIVVKLTDRTFLLGTLFTLVVLVALSGVQAWMSGRTTTYDVAVTTSSGPTAADLAGEVARQAPEIDDSVAVDVHEVADEASARAALVEEDADAWLRPAAEGEGWLLVTRDTAPTDLRTVVETVVRDRALAANAAAVDSSVAELTEGAELGVEQLDGAPAQSALQDILSFAFAMLFYIAVLVFGMTLATSVLEEKHSRLAEMIAAAIAPRQLLAGKILGNAALALAQMALYVVVGVVGLSFTEYSAVLTGVSGAIGWFLVFFLAGFLALSCLWAVAGALASRQEDLQSTTAPVTTLTLVLFFGGLLLEGPALTIASFVPPLSALLMPVRLVEGDVAWWEPVLAMVLLIGLAAALTGLAERVYRRALLQTQGRLSIRQALRVEE